MLYPQVQGSLKPCLIPLSPSLLSTSFGFLSVLWTFQAFSQFTAFAFVRSVWNAFLSLSLSLFFLNFYWSVVALQCCVSFCYKAKWISLCIHISPLLGISFPVRSTQDWVEFLVLYSRFSLVIYFIHSTIYIYVSSNLPVHPTSSFPLLGSIYLLSILVFLLLLCK